MTTLVIYLLAASGVSALVGAWAGLRYAQGIIDADVVAELNPDSVVRKWEYERWRLDPATGKKIITGNAVIAAIEGVDGKRRMWFSDGNEERWKDNRIYGLLKLWVIGGDLPPQDIEDHIGPNPPEKKAKKKDAAE